MRALKLLAALLAFGFHIPLAFAGEAYVIISSPTDGAKLSKAVQIKVNYEVAPGPEGNHTHLYVDGKDPVVLRQLKGSHTLEALTPGDHEICIKVVNKMHTPIGVQKCIKVSVK